MVLPVFAIRLQTEFYMQLGRSLRLFGSLVVIRYLGTLMGSMALDLGLRCQSAIRPGAAEAVSEEQIC
jgi:hypothetical protein